MKILERERTSLLSLFFGSLESDGCAEVQVAVCGRDDEATSVLLLTTERFQLDVTVHVLCIDFYARVKVKGSVVVTVLEELAFSLVPVSLFHRCCPNGAETGFGTGILEGYDLVATAVSLCGEPGTAAELCDVDIRLEAVDGFLELWVTVTIA